MKNFLPVLILVSAFTTSDGGLAVGNLAHKLPRLAVLSLSQLPLIEVGTSSLHLLRGEVLQKSWRDDWLSRQKKYFILSSAVSASLFAGAVAHLLILSIFGIPESELLRISLGGAPQAILVGLGVGNMGGTLINGYGREYKKTKNLFENAVEAAANKNSIVIYDVNRVGMMIDSDDKGLTIVDAQRNTEVIDPELEQDLRLVILRDGLPSSLIGRIFNKSDSWSKAIMGEHAKYYRDAPIAYTYRGRNHLGVIKDIDFHAGQGTLVVYNAYDYSELRIASDKRGKPVVVDPNGDVSSKEKFRGVVFVP